SAQANLVPNGDFSAGGTYWTLPASASTSGGQLTMQPTYTPDSYIAISSSIPIASGGDRYRLRFYYSVTSGRFRTTVANAHYFNTCDGGYCPPLNFSLPSTSGPASGHVDMDI